MILECIKEKIACKGRRNCDFVMLPSRLLEKPHAVLIMALFKRYEKLETIQKE